MYNRITVKENAKQRLKANYLNCVLVVLVSMIASKILDILQEPEKFSIEYITSFGQKVAELDAGTKLFFTITGFVFALLVAAPVTYGKIRFFVKNTEHSPAFTDMLGVLLYYGKCVWFDLLAGIKVGLWSLLFLIPGIIKYFEYAMIPYILAEDPNISSSDAFAESRRIMTGHKWDLFVLEFSFIGWAILSALTMGISGLLYSEPYRCAAIAEFYKTIK